MIKHAKIIKLKNKNFLITPVPLKNELFSSWLIRTAYAHKTHPHTFVNLFLDVKHGAFFSTNIDVTIDKNIIELIEQKSNHNLDINSLTLNTYAGYLQEKIVTMGLNKFLCSLRFCPVCLREDKIPYFRKEWKVVFSTICVKHNCFLYDKCPQCKSNLDISKMYKNKLTFTYCYKCGFELSKIRKLTINKKYHSGIRYSKTILNTLDNGYISLKNDCIYSFYFFDVLAKMAKLIIKKNKVKTIEKNPLFGILKTTCKNKRSRKPAYISISIKEQFALFGLVMHLFKRYPYSLERFIKLNRLSHWTLVRDMDYLPFWFNSLLDTIQPRYIPISRMINNEEIKNAKKYFLSHNLVINKANFSRLFGCNFFSKYNHLEELL
jgi:Zn ribbon nucleic-acid-binding protein